MAKPKSNRERAVELFEKGSTQAELARQLEVSRVTAMKWQRIWQDSGRDGLLIPGRPGRKPRLTETEMVQIRRALQATPRDSGVPADTWSLDSVVALIEKETRVRYHPRHISRLLRRMGWVIPPVGKCSLQAFVCAPAQDMDGNPILLMANPH